MTTEMEDCKYILTDLPDETLVKILRYLHFKDLVRLSSTCQKLHRLCGDDVLWRWQCQHYFLEEQCTEGKSWRQFFSTLHQQFGRYPDYKELKIAWTKIRKFLKERCPKIHSEIQSGCSEEDLDRLERMINHSLPLDVRVSYRICDGQDGTKEADGVLGGCIIHHFSVTMKMLSVQDIMTAHFPDIFQSWLETSGRPETEFVRLGLLDFAEHTETTRRLFFAYSDCGGFTPGFVYKPLTELEIDPNTDFFCLGSFKDYIIDYANKLSSNAYYIVDECIYKFYHEPSCLATTSGITVKPTVCFMPDLSRRYNYFFAYRIILIMAKDAPKSLSCQLETRHWVITDGTGEVEYVNGPGVVGEHPIMRPGEEFSWISCCTFTTPTGNMKGHFRFRNLITGDMVDIECPCFHMKCPPIIDQECDI